jgi:hypothetical protein
MIPDGYVPVNKPTEDNPIFTNGTNPFENNEE